MLEPHDLRHAVAMEILEVHRGQLQFSVHQGRVLHCPWHDALSALIRPPTCRLTAALCPHTIPLTRADSPDLRRWPPMFAVASGLLGGRRPSPEDYVTTRR